MGSIGFQVDHYGMVKPEAKSLVKKGLPWLKRLQGALDDDDSSDSSQPTQITPVKVKKNRPETEEKDPRRRVKKKRLRQYEDNDSDDAALKDIDDAKEKRRSRLKKPTKTRHKRLVDEESKTSPRERTGGSPVDAAKAAASREQRMYKLHTNRVNTGEFDKMAPFKLNRQVSSKALKEKKRNRMRAIRAARDVQKNSTEADVDDEGESRRRSLSRPEGSADKSVKRKLRKTAALEKVDKKTEQADSPTLAQNDGGKNEEGSHAAVKAEPVEVEKHDGEKDGKVEGFMISPDPVKPEDKERDLSSITKNSCNELVKPEGNGGECSEDIKVEFSERETAEIAVKAEVNACEGIKNKCTTQKKPEDADTTDNVPISGILVKPSNYGSKEQKKMESFDVAESVWEKEGNGEGQMDISGVTEAMKSEDGDEKKISEEKKDLLLDMMPIPRKAPNGGKPTAPSPRAESFVIPKRTFSKTDFTGPKTTDQNERADITELRASVCKRSLDSPAPVTMLPSTSPESSPKLPRQEQRKRTKNPVPVKNASFSSRDRTLMRLSRKRNSIYMAAVELADRVPDCRSSRTKSATRMMGYEVYDVDGKTMPDLIPRLSCATKREMASNQESYTASFFGVSHFAPMAKGGSNLSIDNRGDNEFDTRKISCYEELRFERPEDREFYQQKMYGTSFVPQKLRGRITLVVRNARFERKSTGIRFNQDRDREEFAASLSKRYTFKKSIPRCDIPRENWQKLMRNQSGTVYLHYYNREDAERASHIFRDDDGQPLVLRLELKAGAKIISSFAATRPSPQRTPPRSYSNERSVPESSPLLSQYDSAHSTPSWRRERPPASSGDSRYSKYDRGAPPPPAPWSRGEDRYGPSLSENNRSRALLERRARSRSRSKSFRSQHYGISHQESRAGSGAAERSNTQQYASDRHFRSDGGNENAGSVAHSDADTPAPKRSRTLSRSPHQSPTHDQDRSAHVKKNGGDIRGQDDGEIKNSSEIAPTSSVGFSDGGDNRREMQRDRSPSGRWQQKSHSSQTQRRRDSFSINLCDRSRRYVTPQRSTLQPNRDSDQQGSRLRSRPSTSSPSRGGREGDRFKERRGSRDFGRGDAYGNNSRERHMHSDRSRGGYSGGRNSRPR